jgi:hypothetical protein
MTWRSALALLALLCVATIPLSAAPVSQSICDNTPGNLVLNCGFETGDFTDWLVTGNTGSTFVNVGGYANSGNYGAALGPAGSDGLLTQTLPTVAGTVNVSFYLMNMDGTPNDFTVNWDGIDMGPNLLNAGSFAYIQYYGVLASTGNDTLQFQYRQDSAYFGLDDIVVTQETTGAPEPGTIGMLFGGLGLIVVGLRRRRA